MIYHLSARLAKAEMVFAAGLAAAVTVLILLNVVTRTLGTALFWVDELTIYAMIWMTFLGTSAGLHYGHLIAITILTDRLPSAVRFAVMKCVHLIILIFSLFMIWMCILWFQPFALWQSQFDIDVFQTQNFNFIYSEQTVTLPFKKYLVWSVMWFFSLSMTIHSLGLLLDFRPEDKAEK